MVLVFAFLIGLFAGLRSLTALVATAWAAHLGWLKLHGALALIGSTVSVAIFTLIAAAELVADKLPNTPNRTSPPGLIARIVTGGLTGACITVGGGSGVFPGAVFGVVGGVVGCFGGFHARRGLVKSLRTPDIYIALLEDFISIAGSLWAVSRF
jgi:uncharacterized membrane protein